jgi:DNA-directed RNA polymerase subunit beta'
MAEKPITFRPMVERDYLNLGGQVTSGYSKNRYEVLENGLNSTKIFGEAASRSEEEMACTRDNVRAYIKLHKPIVNYVLAGPNASRLRAILGIGRREIDDILNFDTVWSRVAKAYVKPAEINDTEDMVCGAEILKMLIDNLDLESSLKLEFRRLIAKRFIGADCASPYNIGTVQRKSGQIHLLGDWYITLNKDYKWTDKVEYFIKNDAVTTPDSAIVYLINMKDKNGLYGCVSNYISVTPPGIRPSIAIGQDTTTIKYAEVITANDYLRSAIYGDSEPHEVIEKYKILMRKTQELCYKSDPTNRNYFSFSEKIRGKTSLIRGSMLSKRANYSGRSTIVVNPKLSLDQCGLPDEIIEKTFRYHHLKSMPMPNLDKVKDRSVEENVNDIIKQGLLNKVPVALNRAPTLHKLSYLAFHAQRSKSRAIELNPLVCVGFNADFDGDTMAVHVPLGDEAIYEMENLMLSTKNLFMPANGKPTLVPRQEIIYGLNVATSKKYKKGTSVKMYNDLDSLVVDVMNHKVKVYDTVTVAGIGTDLAGSHSMRWTLPKALHDNIIEVTKGSIEYYVENILTFGTDAYKKSIDRMVSLGFRLAKLYAPTVTILNDMDDEFLNNPFKDFHANMKSINRMHSLGFEDENTYNEKFSSELDEVNKIVQIKIKEGLGQDNGYLRLVESGARGDVNNLIQIYAFKGRIKKSDHDSFNAIIENSFAKQLTPLEHFISAYGTRKGLIDKVQKTGDTGYADRLMFDAGSDAIITNHDCGTEKGIHISKKDILRFVKIDGDKEKKLAKAEEILCDIIIGRYEAVTNRYITKEYAQQLVKSKEAVVIRSVLTCSDPFCSKCYGDDLSIRGKAVVGLPIGYIAGQSIGEPGTQLTMRTFHKGGVAGKSDVTSDFDRMQAFISVSKLEGNFTTYDPIAWSTGEVKEKIADATSKVVTIGDDSRKKTLPITAKLKKTVTRGEGLCLIEGDHWVREVRDNTSIGDAQLYLFYLLHTTYLGKADINAKHFEVLVSQMTLSFVTRTDREDLKIGCFYNAQELNRGSLSNTEYTTNLYGVKTLQLFKDAALANIALENVNLGIARATLLGTTDILETQMSRLMLGMRPKLGTYYPNYMKDRLQEEMCK